MPRWREPGSVVAKTMNSWAWGALVMKHFSPLSTQRSPSRSAVVRRAAASEPASGSVRANDDSARPLARRPSHVRR